MEIATAAGAAIVHKPVDLLRVMVESGAGSTRERGDRHRSYYFGREIERWAEWRNAPVVTGMPTHHHNDTTLCNGMLIAGIEQGHNMDQLAHRMLEAHWRDDADLADRETLIRLANDVDLDPGPLLDAALSPQVAAIYLANTEEAIARSVFGSPTYFVDGDMFYGQDHLEFVERALAQPFQGVWPRP
jgi:2-hydroxychromene-2-carboxylate isomerase